MKQEQDNEKNYERGDLSGLEADLTAVGATMVSNPAGGTITIATQHSSDRIDVSVEDTGQGIREEDLPRIFDRFFRAEQGEEANATSTGLGLAIAKRILELRGSQISVTSRLSEGTRFQFDLPETRLAA
jgi:two-component system sensor histidine kinase ResE